MSERFYVNCPLAEGTLVLRGPEAHHLATVCRLRPGHRVCLFNGDGQQYPAEIAEVTRREVVLRVLAVESPRRELDFRLDVAAPLPKGDRAQFLVEKLTELGATAFVPLRTRHSVVHPRETRIDRLQRHAVEASKQCQRNVLLQVGELTDWEDYCRDGKLAALKIVAHPGASAATWPAGQDVALAVGPEGGFTDEEIRLAETAGWKVVGLGPRMLRVETAALLLAAWAVRPPS